MPRLILSLSVLVALAAFLIVACNAEPPATPIPPTRTRRATRTPIPPATLKPPPTQPIPTATRIPTNTPEPSPSPTAVAVTQAPASNAGGGSASAGGGLTVWTMAPLIEYFSKIAPATQEGISRPGNVNPLTGLEVSDPALLQRRPILARIGNDPSSREVHAGFNQADLVFEEMIDQKNMVFGITRFTQVFYGQDGTFRPLRSARAVNASLLPMFDGVLISSGGSKGTRFMLSQLPWKDRNLDGDLQNTTICIAPGDYRMRVASTVQHVQEYLASKGLTGTANLRGFQFSNDVPGGSPANTIAFDHGPWPFRTSGNIEWRFDPMRGKYLRFTNGAPHQTQSYPLAGKWAGACAIGTPESEQIASSNVVVLNVKYEPTDFVEDTLNSYSAFVEMTGSGAAQIYRDGVKQDVTWSRPTLTDFFKFTDASGTEVPLKPGNTWFELAPLGYSPTIK